MKIKTKAELALEKALKERGLKPGTKPKKKALRFKMASISYFQRCSYSNLTTGQ